MFGSCFRTLAVILASNFHSNLVTLVTHLLHFFFFFFSAFFFFFAGRRTTWWPYRRALLGQESKRVTVGEVMAKSRDRRARLFRVQMSTGAAGRLGRARRGQRPPARPEPLRPAGQSLERGGPSRLGMAYPAREVVDVKRPRPAAGGLSVGAHELGPQRLVQSQDRAARPTSGSLHDDHPDSGHGPGPGR